MKKAQGEGTTEKACLELVFYEDKSFFLAFEQGSRDDKDKM